jgi:hypothetical protein
MMVVSFTAESVNCLPIISPENIDYLVIDQTLQSSINGGESNALTFSLH